MAHWGHHYRGHKERAKKFRLLKLSFVHGVTSTALHFLPIFLIHLVDRNFWIGHKKNQYFSCSLFDFHLHFS